jgi:hypothetical protein
VEELRIPKRKTTVEFSLEGGTRRHVIVFLSEFASTHAGPERISDLLNGEAEFFPALDPSRDAMCFFHREAITSARVEASLEPADDTAHTIPLEHEVEIRLADGALVRGLVTYVLPPDRARVIDFLNEAPRFFRVLEKDVVVLVNKRHVCEVAAIG